VDDSRTRIILIDVNDESREVMIRRLKAQGYSVEASADPAKGADLALSSPPSAVIADLWMPGISGIQVCRLLRAEPATAEVPVILRGQHNDPRSHFWAERAGADAYLVKGRMGELVRALSKAVAAAPKPDGFFMQLSGGSVDVRDRIARHLDAALFDSVIASEVRALASCGSFERLFDAFSQFLSQVLSYRWIALSTGSGRFALHHHPHIAEIAETEARMALGLAGPSTALRVADEDAENEASGPEPISCMIPFGEAMLGRLVLAPSSKSEPDTATLASLVARELGGPIRMAALMDELQNLARTDALTGLMNRRAFAEMMRAEIASATRYRLPLTLLLLDVDHFKSINDTYGHAAGDSVLSSIGKYLLQSLRLPDAAARWGGEEFVIVLKNTDAGGGGAVGERLRQGIAALETIIGGSEIPATVSMGLASLLPNESFDSLVERADRAMYEAKIGGRNRLVISEPRQLQIPSIKIQFMTG
jgi:two-component system cell cycle response regulator